MNKLEAVGLFDVPNGLRKRRLAPKCFRDTRQSDPSRQAHKSGIRSEVARQPRLHKQYDKQKDHGAKYLEHKKEHLKNKAGAKLHKGVAGLAASYQTASEVR